MLFDFQETPELARMLGSVDLLQRIVGSQWDFVLLYGSDGFIVSGSSSYRHWLGENAPGPAVPLEDKLYAGDRIKFRQYLTDVCRRNTSRTVEWQLECRSGAPCWIQMQMTPYLQEDADRVLVLCKDITRQKQYEQSLKTMAYHDPLTNLPNRRGLQEHFQKMRAYSRRYQLQFAMLVLDLDDFKAVNDRFGHQGGDALLKHFAGKVAASFRSCDVLARVGGDEFIALLTNIPSAAELSAVIHRIYRNLQEGLTLQGRDIAISVSIGAAIFPGDGDSFESLMRHTDAALYEVKGTQKNSFAIYDTAMEGTTDESETDDVQRRCI